MKLDHLFQFVPIYGPQGPVKNSFISPLGPSTSLGNRTFSALLGIVLLVLLFLPKICFSSVQTTNSAASSSDPLISTNDFARSSALGGAFVGLADDPSALFDNPAGLGFLSESQVLLNSQVWAVGTLEESLVGSIAPEKWGGMALGVRYLGYGSFEGRDTVGSLAPGYSADQWAGRVGWGWEALPGLGFGLGLDAVESDLAGTGSLQVQATGGLLWRSKNGFSAGLAYQNLGLGGTGDLSTGTFSLGAAYIFPMGKNDRFLAALSGDLPTQGFTTLRGGLEYSMEDRFFLRVGVQQPLGDNAWGGFSSFTAGLGFRLSDLELDYAYLPYGDLGNSHRFSLGYYFGGPVPENVPGMKDPSASSGTPAKKTGNAIVAGVEEEKAKVPSSSTHPASLPIVPTPPPAMAANPTPGVHTDNDGKTKDNLVLEFDMPDEGQGPTTATPDQETLQQEVVALDASVQKDPGNVKTWWQLGNDYRQLGQKDKAVSCFEQVLKLKPDAGLSDWLKKYKRSAR